MSQTDLNVANGSGATVRADINAHLDALASQSSGASEPSTKFPNQWWLDTSTNILKQRDNANTAWVNVASKPTTTWVPYRNGTLLGDAAEKTVGTASGEVPLVGTKSSTVTLAGLVERSTSAENIAGTDDTVYPTVAGAKEMIDTHTSTGLTLIATITASDAASADFDGLLDGTYDQYMIVGTDINPVTDDANVWIRTDSDGGASYDTAGYSYSWDGKVGATGITASNNSAAQILLNSGVRGLGNAAGESGMLVVWISNPAGTTYEKRLQWQLSFTDSAGNSAFTVGAGSRLATAAIDSIQFLMSSGNLDGVFRLYGLTNS